MTVEITIHPDFLETDDTGTVSKEKMTVSAHKMNDSFSNATFEQEKSCVSTPNVTFEDGGSIVSTAKVSFVDEESIVSSGIVSFEEILKRTELTERTRENVSLLRRAITDDIFSRADVVNLISPIHYEGLQRIEPLEIPEDSLREAIFNSIIHKLYTGVHTQMKVWNDKIELWNDGGLPFDMTIESLMSEHSSKPRNPNIAAVFYKAGFIESWGRGITKIRNGFLSAGLPEPLFEENCGGVRVTMYRPQMPGIGKNADADGAKEAVMKAGGESDFREKTKEEIDFKGKTGEKTGEKILQLMRNNPLITYDEMAKKLSMSKSGVGYAVRKLRDKGLIERVGPDKGGKWKVN